MAIYHNEVIVSLEKLYCLLLDRSESISKTETTFHMYSDLDNLGLDIEEYCPDTDADKNVAPAEEHNNQLHIWNHYSQLMSPSGQRNENCPVMSSMNRTKDVIIGQKAVDVSDFGSVANCNLSSKVEQRMNHFMVCNGLWQNILQKIDTIRPIESVDASDSLHAAFRVIKYSDEPSLIVYISRYDMIMHNFFLHI